MKLGLLRKYKHPMNKDFVAALIAKEKNVDAIFFNIEDVNFKNMTIEGLSLRNGQWERSISYIPDVIYNDIPRKSDEKLYKKLEDSGVIFTTHRLGINKKDFQHIMMRDDILSNFSIPTFSYKTVDDLINIIEQYKAIFIKPNRGHKGEGMYSVEYDTFKKKVIVTETSGSIKHLDTLKFKNYIEDRVNQYYHIQPKLSSYTKSNDPYVIRTYVGKNGKGQWTVVFHYAVIGLNSNPIVNVSQGSPISYITPFLKTNFSSNYSKIKNTLDTNALIIASRTEEIVGYELDALGLDVCLTEQGEYFLYEVNAFPGTRPFEALCERFAVSHALSLRV